MRSRSGVRERCAVARVGLRAARVFRNTFACSHTERRVSRAIADKVDAREAIAPARLPKVF
jgi:hypothetical protein